MKAAIGPIFYIFSTIGVIATMSTLVFMVIMTSDSFVKVTCSTYSVCSKTPANSMLPSLM